MAQILKPPLSYSLTVAGKKKKKKKIQKHRGIKMNMVNALGAVQTVQVLNINLRDEERLTPDILV